MSELPDFLLARIAEDEEVQPGAGGLIYGAHWSSARVLAECEAKRRILELHGDLDSPDVYVDAWVASTATLRLLALPYADHPDYREEWRP